MRQFSLIGVFVVIALALAACGDGKPVRAPCPQGWLCLERGNGAEAGTLDPLKASLTNEDSIISDMIVGLTQSAPDGSTVPGVATDWAASPDGLTWTFHLRKDALWSDGVPVTADDFVFAMRRILDPAQASEYASILYPIKNAEPVNSSKMPTTALGVRAIDPHTLEISLEHPAPFLPEMLQHQASYPVPKHVVEKYGDHWTDPGKYVSNGPYTLVSWKLGDRTILKKNPKFWDADKVCIDQVSFYPIVDGVTAERRVRRGELDMNADIQSNRIAFLRRPDQIPDYVHVHTYMGTAYLVLNGNNPKFKDPRVRRALTMAIDRDFITKKLLRGGQQPAYVFVPPGVANYDQVPNPEWASWTFEKRQAEARRLLAEAGYGPGHPLKLAITHRNTPDPSLVMPAIQADWRSVGVEVELLANEAQIAYQAYKIRDFEVADAGWIADYNDAMTFLYLLQSQTGANNYGDFNDPAYDKLLADADNEPDVKKREALLQQAEEYMLGKDAVLPTYYFIDKNLVNPRVTGFVDNLMDKHRTRYLCFKDAKR
ncbi:MAG TPA: peptide ABC transporter substrate-binding protein [Caulobacteraceae bacterium]|nr:peptide ABC transporter substrate-binding protein [Caulobacteraceae bacterium]